MDESLLQAIVLSSSAKQKGNWVTFPFVTGTMVGLTLAGVGYLCNLIVYLIDEFNFESIGAAQIFILVTGGNYLFPIVGAIVADSFPGNFPLSLYLPGLVLLVLTAVLHPLRPTRCETGSSLCQAPSKFQYTILYGALVLASLGFGGSRYTLATMGANQFNNTEDQNTFFSWFFFTLYSSSVVGATAIVYVEDSISWALGFGLCLAANFFGLVVFLLGNKFYRHNKPEGSPFTDLARVVVATIRKRKVLLSLRKEDYYHGKDARAKETTVSVTKSFRFFNRAAMKTEDDFKPDGSIAKGRICSVQQVEGFKVLIRIFPILSSYIYVCTPVAVQASLSVLQALVMDRHLGQRFTIPAGSISVLVLITSSISVPFIDQTFTPLWRMLTSKSPTPLQIIGAGHVLNVLSMVFSALIESKRLSIAHAHKHPDGRMTVLWLIPQLVLVGVGEAFHFPGQVALYYKEFPVSLRSTGTAIVTFIVGISFFLSTVVIALVRRVTHWLPDNIDDGRVNNVYWVMVVLGAINFAYFLICAKLYSYQYVDSSSSTSKPTEMRTEK